MTAGLAARRTRAGRGLVPRALKPHRRWMRYHVARALVATLAHAPTRPTGRLVGALAPLVRALMPGQRGLVDEQLRVAYPDATSSWRRRVGVAAFAEMGRHAVDTARLGRRGRSWLDQIPLERGRWDALPGGGLIVVTAHLGPWELLPSILARRRAGGVAAVVRRVREARLDRLVGALRTRAGVRLISRADALACARALGRGETLTIAADQTPRGRRIAGTFLGAPAWLSGGPATLAVLCRVPIVPMVVRRSARGGWQVRVGPVLHADPSRPRHAEVSRLTTAWTAAIEEWIREDPAQWAWFHERWKDAPPA